MAKIDKSKMACNKPKRQVSGGKKFVVKACQNGKEKIIRFGDANMKIKKNQPGRRKNFRARHGCDSRPPSKMTARYWSCKKWQVIMAAPKAKSKKDACYYKVKARYKVWPSAYASGALAKCRKVGAANWGNKSGRKKK